MSDPLPEILSAEMDLPCDDVQETAGFFTDTLGFLLHTIYPADDPSVAVISGYGVRLRLVRGLKADPGRLHLLGPADRASLTAPNGTRIDFGPVDPWPDIPDGVPSFHVSLPPGRDGWGQGRAGMQYRDLIPDRWGGRFIASHIRIPTGGPVPDYVHFHKVRFQMIFCYKGWVRLVYEDQGEPFIMKAGDCVLQPPEIRHRVLEASDGLEVVEIGCPADHPTHVDHILPLPTEFLRPERDFGGQRFVFHQAEGADWIPWEGAGFDCRDLGISAATGGLADVRVVHRDSGSTEAIKSAPEFHFLFGLEGAGSLSVEGEEPVTLSPGASVAIPGGRAVSLDASAPFEFLEVRL
ncbi:MAG: cupin domain-containing protein [Alphaproteobacteria bacterium]|nr:cupin domain-containing protein [Alphaproteobacteria bacterium]